MSEEVPRIIKDLKDMDGFNIIGAYPFKDGVHRLFLKSFDGLRMEPVYIGTDLIEKWFGLDKNDKSFTPPESTCEPV